MVLFDIYFVVGGVFQFHAFGLDRPVALPLPAHLHAVAHHQIAYRDVLAVVAPDLGRRADHHDPALSAGEHRDLLTLNGGDDALQPHLQQWGQRGVVIILGVAGAAVLTGAGAVIADVDVLGVAGAAVLALAAVVLIDADCLILVVALDVADIIRVVALEQAPNCRRGVRIAGDGGEAGSGAA